MPTPQKIAITVSVRDLVAFVLCSGSLQRGLGFVDPSAAVLGTLGHQQIQQERPEGYQAEVSLRYQQETEEYIFTLRGRVDGVWEKEQSVLIEEIKTVSGHQDIAAKPSHWAQAKLYAFVYAQQNDLEEIDVQLTYLSRKSWESESFCETFSKQTLRAFFDELTSEYIQWCLHDAQWQTIRDDSIHSLAFPFGEYRDGQRALAVQVYRTLTKEGRLFLEAPTGTGKTIAVLFPALKAMGEGTFSKLFYLTAKTVGRIVAEETFALMRKAGLHIRVVSLTAKDKICFSEDPPCDVEECPYAIGYYDRLKDALKGALQQEVFDRHAIEELAKKYKVCPFEFSLDLSAWADVIVCDYNYAFDPKVHLKRYFADPKGDYAFLIDEAHHLVDRARNMFSASLEKKAILNVKRMLQASFPKAARSLHKINRCLVALRKQTEEAQELATTEPSFFLKHTLVIEEAPKELLGFLQQFLVEAEGCLAQTNSQELQEELLAFYFHVRDFLGIAALFDERFVAYYNAQKKQEELSLFCRDPSFLLQEALERAKASIFFSATLRPMPYFQELLGGVPDDQVLQLPSPFASEHLEIVIEARIATDYRSRRATYGDVAESIASFVQATPGNYIVYFPSYRYMETVFDHFTQRHPQLETLAQTPAMREDERDAFLACFVEQSEKPFVGFAVMGGIFGEGIDLVGERLIGVVVVGVGLPQLCIERDLIREYFEEKHRAGFQYAYTYPGMNKVLQAVGRVIRSEEDRGRVMLIDKRFGQQRYRQLFPPWWLVRSFKR